MHINRIDSRIAPLKDIISPFQKQLNELRKIVEENGIDLWDQIYADDFEHIVGIVFIALQNYINSSINDLFPELEKLYTKYTIDEKILNSNTTRIELIISIANFYKHRDLHSELKKHTTKHLINLNIDYKVIVDNEKDLWFHEVGSSSPVYRGFSILSESWNFNDLLEIVSEWREGMWKIEENINSK